MILGFKQKFPWGEPTHFREKILAGAGYLPTKETADKIKGSSGIITHPDAIYTPKLHTFREDPQNRWKVGMKVDMVYRGAGYKILDHFNKDIPELSTIKSIQKIQLKWVKTKITDERTIHTLLIFIDNKAFPFERYEQLFANDGFGSTVDFFMWFKKDWSGKILHWTDLRY